MELLRNLALETAILDAPDDLAPRMVYGDWLTEQGDPRGPWFALSAAVEQNPLDVRLRSAATEVFHEHGHLFLGAGVGLRPNTWFGWLGGFLDEIRIQPFPGMSQRPIAMIRQLLEHPHVRFLRHVALGDIFQLPEAVAAVATADLPLLDSVTLVDTNVGGERLSIDDLLDVRTLRKLGANRVRWSRVALQLRELCVTLDGAKLLEQVALFPNLEKLTLDCEGAPELRGHEIARLLGSLPFVRELRVLNLRGADELIGALTPPPPQLTLVDVSHSPLSNEAALRVASWPPRVAFRAIRTVLTPETVATLSLRDRSVVVTNPMPASSWYTDTGGDTWWVHRAKTDGRAGLRIVPDGGRQLYLSATRSDTGRFFDPDVMDVCVTLPSQANQTRTWASAAAGRSWRKEYALCEAIAREGLMREPAEPNFYAFVTYCLRKQGLLEEAAAEVPRAEKALRAPGPNAHPDGPPLCLQNCMFTLAQVGDFAGALALADRLPHLDDPNLQAVRAICHAALGEVEAARAALVKAGTIGPSTPAYVNEPARRIVYSHAIASCALLPPTPDLELAMDHLEPAWTAYPEREWFRTDPTLEAVRQHPRWRTLVG